MFEKLQKLLFEEDDDDIEEEEEVKEEVKPAKRVEKAEPEKKPAPAIKPINVSPQPSVKPQAPAPVNVPAASAVSHVAPKPLPADDAKKEAPEAPKTGFGLTIDTPKPASASKPQPAKKPSSVARTATYEFRPVISPMFGVDETDMDAIANTAKRLEETEDSSNVSDIISPIYGTNLNGAQDAFASMQTNAPGRSVKPAAKENELDTIARKRAQKSVEDDLPDFSLDDILNARDEEFARENKTADAASETIDETVVIDSKSIKDSAK